MNFEFEHREIRTIEESVKKQREEIWNNYPISKSKDFEKIKKVRKHFEAVTNPFMEEGRCNNILEKIRDYDKMLIKEMEK